MSKTNCWEFKGCGREPGGAKVGEQGVCPAAREQRLNGEHGGMNAGRCCWMVAGTLCNGEMQGTFAQKMHNCLDCDFYKEVKNDEGRHFQMSTSLLKKMGGLAIKV